MDDKIISQPKWGTIEIDIVSPKCKREIGRMHEAMFKAPFLAVASYSIMHDEGLFW